VSRNQQGENNKQGSSASSNVTDFASPITGVTGRLIRLLRAQKFRQHSLVTGRAHRQREFGAIQANDLSTPTAFDGQSGLLLEFFFIRQSVFDL
jgi:hypothetical protein